MSLQPTDKEKIISNQLPFGTIVKCLSIHSSSYLYSLKYNNVLWIHYYRFSDGDIIKIAKEIDNEANIKIYSDGFYIDEN